MSIEYVALFIMLLIALIVTLKKKSESKEHKDLVAFSSGRTGTGLSLIDYLKNAQNDLKLSDEYKVFGREEWSYAEKIIEEYQKYVLDKYFSDELYFPKSKYVIRGNDFFMFKLQYYLDCHMCESYFGDYDMHERILKRNGNSYTFSDTTYLLTDFAIVFVKLYYISFSYCKQSKIMSSHLNPFMDLKEIENTISTKKLEVHRR